MRGSTLSALGLHACVSGSGTRGCACGESTAGHKRHREGLGSGDEAEHEKRRCGGKQAVET